MAMEDSRRAALEAALDHCFDDPGLSPGGLFHDRRDWIARNADRLEALGAFAFRPGDAVAPAPLTGIPEEPTWLFARGTLPEPDQPAIAIVGSRRPSPTGLRFTRAAARLLADAGVVVVSGLARGIDGEAHHAALGTGGPSHGTAGSVRCATIAVLAHGLDVTYPPEHRALAASIIERGAVITEFPPGSPPARYRFLRRNRLLSGLGRGVVVVEARSRSGALVTTDYALRQGREVFAVPGDVFNEAAAGANWLIAEGATPVTSPEDLLVRCRALPGFEGLLVPDRSREACESHGSLEEQLEATPLGAEELASRSGRPVEEVRLELLELELLGRVRRWPGGFVRA